MHQVNVYYTFCSLNAVNPKIYLKYQRALADKLLNYGFKDKFGIEFKRDNIAKGRYGKPYYKKEKNFWFNVSNTNGLIVCALSNREVGVDTEKIRNVRMSVMHRCCTETEIAYITKEDMISTEEGLLQRFFQIWTLKESYIKMTGEGMHFPMKEVVFTIASEAPQYDHTVVSQDISSGHPIMPFGVSQDIPSGHPIMPFGVLQGIKKEPKNNMQIICNQPAFFMQKQIKDYWISVCSSHEIDVSWKEITIEEI